MSRWMFGVVVLTVATLLGGCATEETCSLYDRDSVTSHIICAQGSISIVGVSNGTIMAGSTVEVIAEDTCGGKGVPVSVSFCSIEGWKEDAQLYPYTMANSVTVTVPVSLPVNSCVMLCICWTCPGQSPTCFVYFYTVI